MAYKKGQDRRQRVLFPDCIDEYVEADAPVRSYEHKVWRCIGAGYATNII